MSIRKTKPHPFDLHRKSHAGRGVAMGATVLVSITLWVLILVAASRLF